MDGGWPGALILAIGLGPRGAAVSTAGNIAGAACLAIDPRPEACRAALLSGACDFIVNTVDEALRILKNQIRQRRPVSVGWRLRRMPRWVSCWSGACAGVVYRGGCRLLPQQSRPLLDPATRDRALHALAPLGN